MYKFFRFFLIFSLSVSFWTVSLSAREFRRGPIIISPSKFSNPKQVAIVVSVKGKSIITRSNGKMYLAKHTFPIYVGDRIDTGLGAFLQIDFIDHSKISLQGSSDFTVRSYSYSTKEDIEYKAKIDNGFLSFMAGNIGKIAPQKYKIETSTATIGIRGTSGEIMTSDGSLPGRPLKMEVMKKGGSGISLTPKIEGPNPAAAPIFVVTESGRGFSVEASGKVERVAFKSSPLEKYKKEENTRIEKEKKKVIAKKEKEVLLEEEGEPEKREDAFMDSEDPKEASPAEIREDGELIVAFDEEKEFLESSLLDSYDPSVEEGFVLANVDPSLIKEFGVEEFDFDQSFSNFDAVVFTRDDFMADVSSIVEETQEIAGGTISDVSEANRLQELVKQQEIEQSSQAVDYFDETIDYSGYFIGGNYRSSYGEEIFSKYDEDDGEIEILDGDLEDLFEFTHSLQRKGDTFQGVSSNDSSPSFHAVYDNLHEFFIVNRSQEGSEAFKDLIYFGKVSTSAEGGSSIVYGDEVVYNYSVESNIPPSGIRFYENDSSSESFFGSLLTKDGQAINNGSRSISAVDFSNAKVFGASSGGSYFLDSSNDTLPDGYQGNLYSGNVFFDTFGDVPVMFYGGELEGGTVVKDLKLYNSLGFAPSPDLFFEDSSSADMVFYKEVLSEFSGTGQLYGSELQGIGFHASDGEGGHFASAAFHNLSDTSIGAFEGSYFGGLQGIHVDDSSSNFLLSHVKGDMDISAFFSQGSIDASLSWSKDGAYTSVSAGGFNLAVDNETIFSEIMGSGSLHLVQEASFLASFDLPSYYTSFNENLSYPQNVFWGTWNLVENDNSVYPGLHNYWSAAMPGQLETSHSILHYTGASLRTSVKGPEISTSSDFPVSDMGISKLVVSPDDGKIFGMHFFDRGEVIIFDGETSDKRSFNGKVAVFNTQGENSSGEGMFSVSWDDNGEFSGTFASDEGQSMVFDYDRNLVDTGENFALQYGVGTAGVSEGLDSLEDINFIGVMEGINFSSGGSAYILQGGSTGVDMNFIYEVKESTETGFYEPSFGGAVKDNYYAREFYLFNDSGDMNLFISKDAFISTVQSIYSDWLGYDQIDNVSFGFPFSEEYLDPSNSYMIGLPGLEDFSYSSWGMWGVKGAATGSRVFGYFGMADETLSLFPDISAISLSQDPVYHYQGRAIGSLFDAENPHGKMMFGSSSLNVNYKLGNMYGEIIFPDDISVYLEGYSLEQNYGETDKLSSQFGGISRLNGSPNQDSFSLRFSGSSGEEAVGAFSAGDDTRALSGAFAAMYSEKFSLDYYKGKMRGAAVCNETGDVDLLSGVEIDLGLEGGGGNAYGSIAAVSEGGDGGTYSNFFLHGEGNAFVSKDEFFSRIGTNPFTTTAKLGEAFPYDSIDSSNSFITSVSGLEDYQYISWGAWMIQGGVKKALGYTAMGKSDESSIPDYSSLRSQDVNVNYSGVSIGTIFDAANPSGIQKTGTASLVVNFSSGSVEGNVSLDSLNINLLGGQIAEGLQGSPLSFTGNTQINGQNLNDGFVGTFHGSMAEEAVGSFNAHDQSLKATGAFGVRRN